MERDQEIAKLVNVLRKTSRMALQSEWTGSNKEVAAFCAEQYNRVLGRLREIDPGVGSVFDPLPEGSSLTVSAMACRQLAAYYEDETGRTGGWGFVPMPKASETNAWATSSNPSDAASLASGVAVRSGRKTPYSTARPRASRKTAVTASAGPVDK